MFAVVAGFRSDVLGFAGVCVVAVLVIGVSSGPFVVILLFIVLVLLMFVSLHLSSNAQW